MLFVMLRHAQVDGLGKPWLRLCAPLRGAKEAEGEKPVVMIFMSDSAM